MDIDPSYHGHGGDVAQLGMRITGRLRSAAALLVWDRVTADPFVHRLLRTGLELPLIGGTWPDRHHCAGNSIKPEYMDWARDAIAELHTHGAVSRWSDFVAEGKGLGARPWMVMPLIVEPKPGRPGKFRLIHDCRILNELLERLPFKMERLQDFVKQLRSDDTLWSIDLASAYHHVEVNERFRTLIGFSFEGVDYVYNCLPFGLRTSAYAFARLTAVTAEVLRISGLVSALIVYLDDFGGSVGRVADHERMAKIVAIVESFGWALAPEKLCIGLGTRIKLLGFMLDTRSMTIGVPHARRDKLRATAEFVLENHKAVQVRKVCQLVGQILSLQLASGLVCRLRSRYLLLAIRDAARVQDYNRVVPIIGRALEELRLWAGSLEHLPEAPMHKHLRRADWVLECDASDHALGAIVVTAPHERFVGASFHRRLAANEARWGSLLREMTGYRDAVVTLARRATLRGAMVEVVGDAQSAQFVFANGGSQVVDEPTGLLLILEALLSIYAVAEREGFEVRFRWVRRCYIQDADDLSKFVDRMDFSLTPEGLAHVWQRFGPWEVDRYASPSNTTCVRFNALFDSVNVEGVNALTQDWRSSVSFVLPNFHELDAILDIIERDNARVVLIVPCWPHQSWFRRLHSAAWAGRIAAWERISGAALMPNTTDCFFGDRFTTDLLVFRTQAVGVCDEG